MEGEEVQTLVGTFTTKGIETDEGELIPCTTYGIVYKKILNKYIVANLRYSKELEVWIIFQYVLLDEEVSQ